MPNLSIFFNLFADKLNRIINRWPEDRCLGILWLNMDESKLVANSPSRYRFTAVFQVCYGFLRYLFFILVNAHISMISLSFCIVLNLTLYSMVVITDPINCLAIRVAALTGTVNK